MINANKIKFAIYWRIRELNEILNLYFSRSQKILVYSMGKVGSTSTYYVLKKVFGGRVFFVHFFKNDNIKAFNYLFIKNGIKPIRDTIPRLFKRLIFDKQKKLKIVTLMRDPIERNISMFFQTFKVYNNGKNYDEISVDEAIQNFINIFPHHQPIKWVQEFYELTNIDFDHFEFDVEKKYKLMDNPNCMILIMRTDLEDEHKEKLMQEFFEIRKIALKRKNISSNKKYSDFYNLFLKQVKLPDYIIDTLYQSDEIIDYYSNNELIEMKQRWSRQA